MRQDLEDLVPCQHSSAWFRGRAVISAPWRHFEHWSLAPHLIPGGSYGSVLCKGQEQYFPPSLCVQQLWSVGFDCPYPAAALKWEVWLPLSNLHAVAEHFINSHNLICLQYKSHPGIILLRAGADWKGEHLLVYIQSLVLSCSRAFFNKHDFSVWLLLPGNFECGNPENLKSKCIWVSEAKEHVLVSGLWAALL